MAATPALFDFMAQQVVQTVEARLAEARQQAQRICAEGLQAAEDRYAQGLIAARAEIDAADRRIRQQVSGEAEKARVGVQHQVVEEVLEEVRREILRRAEGEGFLPILQALLEDVLEEETRSGLVVLAPEPHVDALKHWLEQRGRGELRIEPWPGVMDGVALQDARRSFRVSSTLLGRFESVSNQARKLCQDRLFEEG